MKKKQITYGVSGMMEYQAVIKVGKKNVSINFSDGSISAMGTNPATYTTDNIIMQNAIESSNDFKRGRIHIVRTIDLEEELHVLRNRPKPTQSQAENPASPTHTEDETAREASNGAEDVENRSQNAESNTHADATEEEAEATIPLTQVEFSCNDDAKDYLEQNFGYVRSKLRNREDMINAGKAHGVDIIFV